MGKKYGTNVKTAINDPPMPPDILQKHKPCNADLVQAQIS